MNSLKDSILRSVGVANVIHSARKLASGFRRKSAAVLRPQVADLEAHFPFDFGSIVRLLIDGDDGACDEFWHPEKWVARVASLQF